MEGHLEAGCHHGEGQSRGLCYAILRKGWMGIQVRPWATGPLVTPSDYGSGELAPL